MTTKQRYVCDECAIVSPGIHYDTEDPSRWTWCPSKTAAKAQAAAQAITADAHTEAFKAAKQIIADTAETLPEFSANQCREALDAAQITGPVIGAAFTACIRAGVIEATGRTVPSTDPGTKAHRIFVYRSLSYGRKAS